MPCCEGQQREWRVCQPMGHRLISQLFTFSSSGEGYIQVEREVYKAQYAVNGLLVKSLARE